MTPYGSHRPILVRVDPLATLALTATTVITAVAMHRVFFDWSYLPPMLGTVVAMHVGAAVLRAARAPGWVSLPVLTVTGGCLLVALYYRGSLSGGLPSAATLDLFRSDITYVLDRFATAVAPVASDSSFAAVSTIALMACAVLADTFAFRAGGRSEALVPGAAMFVIASVTGVDRHRVLFATVWVAAAVVAVGLLRARQHRLDFTWMGARSARTAGALVALLPLALAVSVAGAWLGPRLPGAGDEPLIDTRTPVDSVTEVVSPLVDIRAQLRDRGSRELFVAETSGTPRYWRLVSLPEFDGNAWNPPEEDLVELDDAARAPWEGAASVTFEQQILIRALGGPLVPSGYRPADVESDDLDVYWASDSESLVAPRGGLESGDRLRITSTAPVIDAQLLRSTTASGAPAGYSDLPSLPDVIGSTALDVTASATTDFDRALALQRWFRSEFVYDTEVDFGNSGSAIERFLEARRGFCQQFAGTFAVMARSLGLPARVAVGFTPGEQDADGRFHVYGRDAHAWPEVWFADVGWVAFEPTPGRGGGNTGAYLGIEESPGNTVSPTDTTPDSTAPTTTVDRTTAVPASTTVPSTTPTTAASGSPRRLRISGTALRALTAVGILVVLAVVWRAIVVPAVRRRRRRVLATRPAALRVAAHWRRAIRCLEVLGVPHDPSVTPIEVARSAATRSAVDAVAMERLAQLVTQAAYSSAPPDDSAADAAAALADSIERECRDHLTGWPGRRAVIDPWYLVSPRRPERPPSDAH